MAPIPMGGLIAGLVDQWVNGWVHDKLVKSKNWI